MRFRSERRGKSKVSVFLCVVGVLLGIYTVSLFVPLLWGLLSSFKTSEDFTLNAVSLPKSWVLENYVMAFKYFFVQVQDGAQNRYVYIEEMAVNSILYAGGCALCATFTSCITAYATARYRYKLSKVVYAVVIVTMILPIVGSLPSELQMLRYLNLYDKIVGTWLMKANFLGMYYLVFYETFRNFAKDYSEAASIDGASQLRILLNIMIPMVSNVIVTVALINFVAFWNDYQTPYVYIPNHPTLAYGLFMFSGYSHPEISGPTYKLAGSMMVFVPVFIVFLCFQKRLMGNISMGGIKE